jgi:hypothetical protein
MIDFRAFLRGSWLLGAAAAVWMGSESWVLAQEGARESPTQMTWQIGARLTALVVFVAASVAIASKSAHRDDRPKEPYE